MMNRKINLLLQRLLFLVLLVATIVQSHSNTIWEPEYTYCDEISNICENFVNVNLTFNSSSMEIMFGDAENQFPHAFFDDINVRYSLQGSDSFILYDGDLQEEINCQCIDPLTSAQEYVKLNICPSVDESQADFLAIFLVEPEHSSCPSVSYTQTCCRSLQLQDPRAFRVFPNLTCQFSDMQFRYKKQNYQLDFSHVSTELIDMNITWLGGQQWTFPTDTLALLEDLDTGEIKFTFLKSINLPAQSHIWKAGWWQGSESTTNWMKMMIPQNNSISSFNLSIPRIDAIQVNNLDIKRIECEQQEGGEIDGDYFSSYTMLVKRTRIMGENGRVLDYIPGSIGNITILVSGYPIRLCVNYPTICLCNNTEILQCLDYQGFISIKDYSSNTYTLGFLNNTLVYRTPICSGSEFFLSRAPHDVLINIRSNNLIPRYFMSDCQLEWQNLGPQNLSISCNCPFLPCKIRDNFGSIKDINISNDPQYLTWENNSEWFELTCGKNPSQRIDRYATIYAPFLTSSVGDSSVEEDSRDFMQSFVFNLLFFGYNSILTLIIWAILTGISYFFYTSIGRTPTAIIWALFLMFYYIGGVLFLLFIIAFGIGYNSCLPCLITMNRARTVASIAKDVYQAV